MWRALILLLLFAVHVEATQYHVRKDGSDSNAGTATNAAFLTIQKAENTVVAGDRIKIWEGTYKENPTNITSGTAGSPIIIEGVRGSDGSWLTIIDPSEQLTNNWTLDANWGSAGVYRNTSGSFNAAVLSIANKRVASVYTTNVLVNWDQAYSDALSNGVQFLTLTNGGLLTMKQNSNQKVGFWDNVGALWASQGTTNWIRFSDNRDPNGEDIRITRNSTSFQVGTTYAGMRFDNRSHIIVSNLYIRNAFTGFYLNACTNVVVESNRVQGGYTKIACIVGASTNRIANNLVTTDYYGYSDPGAWSGGNSNRANLYVVAKFLMSSAAETFDLGISLDSCGSGNTVVGNIVTNGIGQGIELTCNLGSYPPYTNTVVMSNFVANWASIGTISSTGSRYLYIHDNDIIDNNLNFRAHKIDDSNDPYRPVWFYRNRLWLPTNVASHIYFHCNSATKTGYEAEYNLYHNSFNGGLGGAEVSAFAYAKSGMTNTWWCNNVFSGSPYWYSDNSAWKTSTVNFDYNILRVPFPDYPSTNVPAWFGASNVVFTTNFWSTSRGTDPIALAIFDRGINTESTFTLNGASRAALPDSLLLTVGNKESGAYEFYPATRQIDTTNIIDWTTYAGVEGGIPYRTTIYTSLPPTVSAFTFNQAVTNCPVGQVILLSNGVFKFLTAPVAKSNITVRGLGPENTTVNLGAAWQIGTSGYSRSYHGIYEASLARGATSFNLTSAPTALVVGQSIMVTMTNAMITNTSVLPYPWGHESDTALLTTYADEPENGTHIKGQMVRVTAIANTTNITFTPALSSAYTGELRITWVPSTSEFIYWNGLENMTIRTPPGALALYLQGVQNCWISNVVFDIRPWSSAYPAIQGYYSHHVTVDHCWFRGYAAISDAVNPWVHGDGWLVVNNIGERLNKMCLTSGRGGRHVVAYNYVDSFTNSGSTALIAEYGLHGGHQEYNLFEGNVGFKFHGDGIHGGHEHITLFRNFWRGIQSGNTFGAGCINVDGYNYHYQIGGNVLGIPGQSGWIYQETSPGGTSTNAEWAWNYYGYNTSDWGGKLADSTANRFDNYSVIFGTNELPSGISLTNSYFYTSRPGFFDEYTGLVWPPHGPDVSNYTNMIPAERRFRDVRRQPKFRTILLNR